MIGYSTYSAQPMKQAYPIKKSGALWHGLIVVVSTAIYFASQGLMPYYLDGDQAHYINFYNSTHMADAAVVPTLQMVFTGSAEPLFGYAIWFFSNLGLDKNTFIALSNALLTAVTGLALKKSGANPIIFLLIVTNFYFVVLLTAAERLKFSYLFMIAAFLLPPKGRLLFALLAPFFHFQTLINYASLLFGRFAEMRVQQFRKASTLVSLFLLLVIVAGGLFFTIEAYGDALTSKFQYYSGQATFHPLQLAAVIALLIMAVTLGVRIGVLIAYMVPIVICVAVLGPERTNMIGFVTIFFLATQNGKLMHPLFLLMLVYFSYKTVDYVNNILTVNTGFL